MDRLKNKVAIVTGGAKGIGRGIAERMIAEGAYVAVFDLEDPGYDVLSFKLDVTDEVAVRGAVNKMLTAGPVDILVNNAGFEGKPGNPFTNNSWADWEHVLNANLKSAVIASMALGDHFIERKSGCIIAISSIAALMPGPLSPPYSVSKEALITFTRIIAKQLGRYRVRANVLAPGLVWTDHWKRLAEASIQSNPELKGMTPRQVYEKRLSEIVPFGLEQTVEEVGEAAVFLASDAARNITGQVIAIDGGVLHKQV